VDPDAIWDGEWGRLRDGCIWMGVVIVKREGAVLEVYYKSVILFTLVVCYFCHVAFVCQTGVIFAQCLMHVLWNISVLTGLQLNSYPRQQMFV